MFGALTPPRPPSRRPACPRPPARPSLPPPPSSPASWPSTCRSTLGLLDVLLRGARRSQSRPRPRPRLLLQSSRPGRLAWHSPPPHFSSSSSVVVVVVFPVSFFPVSFLPEDPVPPGASRASADHGDILRVLVPGSGDPLAGLGLGFGAAGLGFLGAFFALAPAGGGGGLVAAAGTTTGADRGVVVVLVVWPDCRRWTRRRGRQRQRLRPGHRPCHRPRAYGLPGATPRLCWGGLLETTFTVFWRAASVALGFSPCGRRARG